MPRKRSFWKRLRDSTILLLSRLLLFVGRWLPVGLGYHLGGIIGSLGHFLDTRDRQRAREHIAMALPDLEETQVERLAKQSFRHLGRLLFEVLRIPRINRKYIDRHITFEGVEILEEAVQAGRGVVIATGHIGNWELLGAAAVQRGLPLNVIARRLYEERLNDLLLGLRSSSGVKTILRDDADSAKQILRALRSGEMLALLIDQDIDVDGAYVTFFGMPAWTATGAAALAHRTKALFVAAAMQRTAPGKHMVRVREVSFDHSLDRERAIIDATQRATSILENWIRLAPEQWPWFHRRWRRTLNDEKIENK